MSKKVIAGLAVCAVLGAMVSACGSGSSSGETSAKGGCVYKLGALFPITGSLASLGQPDQVGAQAAVDDINSNGGVRGCKLQLIVSDTQSTTSVAVNRMQSLLDQGLYGLVGPQVGSDTLATQGMIGKAKVPACVLGSTITLTQQGNPYIFRCQVNDAAYVDAAILFAKKNLHAQSVALIHTDDAYGTQGAQAFVKASQSGPTQIKLTANVPLSYSGTDFTAQWTRALASNPDAVILWTGGTPVAIALRNARQLNVKQPIVGGSGMVGPSIDAAGKSAEGVYVTDLFDPAQVTPVQQHMIDVIHKRQGAKYQINLYNALSWDTVQLFAMAIKADPKDALAGMESLHSVTLTAGTYRFSKTQRDGLSVDSVVMTQMRNGKLVGVAQGKDLLNGQ